MDMPSLDRTKAPEAQNIEYFSLLPAKKLVLPNGIAVTYLSGGSQEIISMQLEFEGGKLQEEKLGVCNAMAKMISEGSKNYTAQQIASLFDAYGAFWQVSAGTDWTTFDFACLSKHLDKILPMICELLQECTMPESAWQRVQATSIQQLQVAVEKSSIRASRAFKGQLFGTNHPYGSSSSVESIQAIGLEDLRGFYQTHIKKAPFQLFISGAVTDAHLRALEATLGQIPIENRLGQKADFPVPKSDYAPYYEDREGMMQSALRIGKLHFLKNHPDQVAFEVLNTLLGGYFGSRLMQNIREEKGLTYGIYSGTAYLKESSFFYIQADVIKDKREEALQEIYREMKVLQEEKVGEEELNRVKNYRCGSLVKSISSPNSVMNCHKMIWMNDLPANYYDTLTQKIWAVTAEEVQALAQKYFDGSWVESVVG